MIRKIELPFFIILLVYKIVYSQITPISALRFNNTQGVPVDSGNIFTVTGVVTVGNEFNSPSYIQDNTAGIAIYGRGAGQFSSQVLIGDSVTVTGKLTHFRGLTQFDPVSFFSVVGRNKTVEPIFLTIAEINAQNWNGYEAHEGMLIRVNNVTISASGNWVGNTNYIISDGTGYTALRIVNGTTLVGQPIPNGTFDVIGALGAFKNSAPYDASSYQILPKTISDIITDNKPLILLPVIASNITTNSFKVYYETLRPGDTEVRYGLTPSLEIGMLKDTTQTKNHNVTVTGLNPLTKYYFKVYSTNLHGTSEGPLEAVTTASDNPTTGIINVYFNSTVDQTVAIAGNQAKGNVNLTEKLLERINSASYSIDMAVYSFYNQNTTVNALVAARNRGVKVRIVYDKRTTQNSMQSLINAGFLISKRPNINGIMHNKFFIFDARDTDLTNDWIWTGSWNVSADESAWLNNVIEINDYALAQAYTKEFEEMWGSNSDTPNSSTAKFGPYKTDNTPHFFTIGGREVQLYFSPSDQTTSKIRNTLATADSSLFFALLSFTRNDLANEIVTRKNNGAIARGIIENVNDSGSQYLFLKSNIEVFDHNLATTLHHKYGIVDASYPSSNPAVITGSHNWSNAAENDNDENTLIINDIFIANQFMQEFKRRYNDLGGTGTFVVPTYVSVENENVIPTKIRLYQNYPNPFNATTNIKFSIAELGVRNAEYSNPFNPSTVISYQLSAVSHVTLKVFDILGKEIETLVDEVLEPGIHHSTFHIPHSAFTSGVYFYQLRAGSFIETKKMIFIK